MRSYMLVVNLLYDDQTTLIMPSAAAFSSTSGKKRLRKFVSESGYHTNVKQAAGARTTTTDLEAVNAGAEHGLDQRNQVVHVLAHGQEAANHQKHKPLIQRT